MIVLLESIGVNGTCPYQQFGMDSPTPTPILSLGLGPGFKILFNVVSANKRTEVIEPISSKNSTICESRSKAYQIPIGQGLICEIYFFASVNSNFMKRGDAVTHPQCWTGVVLIIIACLHCVYN